MRQVQAALARMERRRSLLIALIVVIVLCCMISALLSVRSGHLARAASTFCAGLAFAFLIGSRLPPKAGRS